MLLRVGLTGGIASGKSVAGREFQRLGCHLIEADKLGHRVLSPGGEAYAPVVAEFGPGIVDPVSGHIGRKALGAIVFPSPERLSKLNAIVHPAVKRLSESMMDGLAGTVIYEAAILIETGGYRDFKRLIVAACPEEMQIERALARDPGMTREAVLERMQTQMPLAEKIRYAHYVLDTSGTLEQTLEQVRNIYHSLLVYGENAP